jgi:hypothetical protein
MVAIITPHCHQRSLSTHLDKEVDNQQIACWGLLEKLVLRYRLYNHPYNGKLHPEKKLVGANDSSSYRTEKTGVGRHSEFTVKETFFFLSKKS